MQTRSSSFGSVPRGRRPADLRSTEAVEPSFSRLKMVAWGLPLILLFFILACGFNTSSTDLVLRFVCVGLVASMGGYLVRQEKRHSSKVQKERKTADQVLAVAKALSTLDLPTLLQCLAEEAVRLIPCRGACAILLNRRQEGAEHIATAGQFPMPQIADLPVLLPKEVRHEALEQRVVVLNSSHAIHTRLRSLRVQEFARQNLLIATVGSSQPEGFLILTDKLGGEDFQESDVYWLTAIASQAAVAIENARTFAQACDTQANQRGLLHELIDAQEQERKCIVEEWHDRLGAKLFDMLQGFRSCQTLVMQRVPEGKERFEQLAADIDAMAALVRGLTNELHPSILDDFGFVAALREYIAGLGEQESFHVTVQAEEVDRQLPAETNLTLFRITQEALRNIRQHAQARNVQIAFVQEHAGVSLMIKDDGQGFNPDQPTQGHFGLLYMRERTEAYGGTFRVVSARGHGTEVWVNFPGRRNPSPRSP